MKQYDLLLIARPDHSYKIYQGLVDSDIKFRYFSFKLFPSWFRYFIKHKKMRTVKDNTSICNVLSIISILKHNLCWTIFQNVSEYDLFEKFIHRQLKKYSGKIVHYWPCFSYKEVKAYKEQHKNTITIAEIYFPCHQYVLDEVGPLLKEMGYDNNLNYIYKEAQMYKETMKFEQNFIVPSDYVANTYRRYYPDKNYIVIPFGIFKSPNYKKKAYVKNGHCFKFIYVGRISIEKGCDVLFDYFQKHLEYTLIVVGSVLESEKNFFEKYKVCTNITFMGIVPNIEVPQIASKCDVGIHLSRFDAYSLAVGEVIGSGLPVIVSNETGNCSDVERNNWGIVTNLDELSVDRAIMQMTDVYKYNSYIDSIDNYFKKERPTYSQKIISLYNSILDNGGRLSK